MELPLIVVCRWMRTVLVHSPVPKCSADLDITKLDGTNCPISSSTLIIVYVQRPDWNLACGTVLSQCQHYYWWPRLSVRVV